MIWPPNHHHHYKAYDDQRQFFAQRHQSNLMAAALPRPKMVIIVLDRGSALTEHQLRVAKSIVKHILNSLSHRDKISLVDLSSSAHDVSGDTCGSNLAMANADYESKHIYGKYIDRLQRSFNSTNHYLGLKKAFEIVEANYLSFKGKFITRHCIESRCLYLFKYRTNRNGTTSTHCLHQPWSTSIIG